MLFRSSAKQTEQSVRLGYWMDWNDTDTLPAMALLAFYPEGFRRVMARARARWDAIEGTRA